MAEDRLANCRSDKGSSRRLAMISCKPFQNASSTLIERSTTDDFMARPPPRRSGGDLRLHWRLNCDVGTLSSVEICRGSAKVPTGLDCGELFWSGHWGLLGQPAGGCEWRSPL